MAWNRFPYPEARYRYDAATLAQHWGRLHGGDAEPFPGQPALVAAWIAFHAGHFEQAYTLGLACGVDGYAVAHKAACVHAVYLDSGAEHRIAALEAVTARCERQQSEQPGNPAGYYWHAYSLEQYARTISVVKALALGIGLKIRDSLEATLRLAPGHADAHVAFGVYHAEVIDKEGAMMGGLTHGASKEEGIRHFKTALALDPGSARARIEFAHALNMLEGKKKMAEAIGLFEQAAESQSYDAQQRLDVEAAKEELEQQG
ncbi:MAG: hypothetical protein V4754_05050 [Pseudomonadota bacterium]